MYRMNFKSIVIAVGVLAAAVSSAAGLPWAKDFKGALAQAKQSHKVVMIDFTASWCVNCHKLDRTTYVDPSVVSGLAGVVPVHVDYDKERPVAAKYKAEALPVIVFVDAQQRELGRITGYKTAKEFMAAATPILSKAKKRS